ncbi:MAG: FG-GAP repeat protein, partial [Candidatus Sericytochromatia bacterium]|nr:FG-GAP repeat protein [Candidatus Tanganyikabacteria bacterium]
AKAFEGAEKAPDMGLARPSVQDSVRSPGAGTGPAPAATTTGSDQYQTTSPGHKSIGHVLRTMAHEAAHTVQQAVRVATADLDGDGRADVAVAGPPGPGIQAVQKVWHDAKMAAIQNIR